MLCHRPLGTLIKEVSGLHTVCGAQSTVSVFTQTVNLSTLIRQVAYLWAAKIRNGEQAMGFETPGKVEENWQDAISSVEEIIEDARNGRMFILVDHEDRENEGDLVIPAQMATPDAINFMAKHGRGLICLTLPKDRIEALGLPLMASSNSSRHETAFTVSIEARDGVTTGISAHDRARTVAVAIDSSKTAEDIATPGHVFPLQARDGGVLVRAGHTEAAVDLSRLA